MIDAGEGKPLVPTTPSINIQLCAKKLHKLSNDPVVMQSEERRQGMGWSPESGSKSVPD